MTEDDYQERKAQSDDYTAVKDVQVILATREGKNFIKYLLINFEVGELPEIGLPEQYLREKMAFLKAGNSIFKIVAAANPEIAGAILGQIEKEKNEKAKYDAARRK